MASFQGLGSGILTAFVSYLMIIQLTGQFMSIGAANPVLMGPFMLHENATLHLIQGDVYKVSDTELMIKNFSYDGKGPHTHFRVGKTDEPTIDATTIPYAGEVPSPNIVELKLPIGTTTLPEFTNQDVTLKFDGVGKVSDYKYLSVWCIYAKRDFAHVHLKVTTPKTAGCSGLIGGKLLSIIGLGMTYLISMVFVQ